MADGGARNIWDIWSVNSSNSVSTFLSDGCKNGDAVVKTECKVEGETSHAGNGAEIITESNDNGNKEIIKAGKDVVKKKKDNVEGLNLECVDNAVQVTTKIGSEEQGITTAKSGARSQIGLFSGLAALKNKFKIPGSITVKQEVDVEIKEELPQSHGGAATSRHSNIFEIAPLLMDQRASPLKDGDKPTVDNMYKSLFKNKDIPLLSFKKILLTPVTESNKGKSVNKDTGKDVSIIEFKTEPDVLGSNKDKSVKNDTDKDASILEIKTEPINKEYEEAEKEMQPRRRSNRRTRKSQPNEINLVDNSPKSCKSISALTEPVQITTEIIEVEEEPGSYKSTPGPSESNESSGNDKRLRSPRLRNRNQKPETITESRDKSPSKISTTPKLNSNEGKNHESLLKPIEVSESVSSEAKCDETPPPEKSPGKKGSKQKKIVTIQESPTRTTRSSAQKLSPQPIVETTVSTTEETSKISPKSKASRIIVISDEEPTAEISTEESLMGSTRAKSLKEITCIDTPEKESSLKDEGLTQNKDIDNLSFTDKPTDKNLMSDQVSNSEESKLPGKSDVNLPVRSPNCDSPLDLSIRKDLVEPQIAEINTKTLSDVGSPIPKRQNSFERDGIFNVFQNTNVMSDKMGNKESTEKSTVPNTEVETTNQSYPAILSKFFINRSKTITLSSSSSDSGMQKKHVIIAEVKPNNASVLTIPDEPQEKQQNQRTPSHQSACDNTIPSSKSTEIEPCNNYSKEIDGNAVASVLSDVNHSAPVNVPEVVSRESASDLEHPKELQASTSLVSNVQLDFCSTVTIRRPYIYESKQPREEPVNSVPLQCTKDNSSCDKVDDKSGTANIIDNEVKDDDTKCDTVTETNSIVDIKKSVDSEIKDDSLKPNSVDATVKDSGVKSQDIGSTASGQDKGDLEEDDCMDKTQQLLIDSLCSSVFTGSTFNDNKDTVTKSTPTFNDNKDCVTKSTPSGQQTKEIHKIQEFSFVEEKCSTDVEIVSVKKEVIILDDEDVKSSTIVVESTINAEQRTVSKRAGETKTLRRSSRAMRPSTKILEVIELQDVDVFGDTSAAKSDEKSEKKLATSEKKLITRRLSNVEKPVNEEAKIVSKPLNVEKLDVYDFDASECDNAMVQTKAKVKKSRSLSTGPSELKDAKPRLDLTAPNVINVEDYGSETLNVVKKKCEPDPAAFKPFSVFSNSVIDKLHSPFLSVSTLPLVASRRLKKYQKWKNKLSYIAGLIDKTEICSKSVAFTHPPDTDIRVQELRLGQSWKDHLLDHKTKRLKMPRTLVYIPKAESPNLSFDVPEEFVIKKSAVGRPRLASEGSQGRQCRPWKNETTETQSNQPDTASIKTRVGKKPGRKPIKKVNESASTSPRRTASPKVQPYILTEADAAKTCEALQIGLPYSEELHSLLTSDNDTSATLSTTSYDLNLLDKRFTSPSPILQFKQMTPNVKESDCKMTPDLRHQSITGSPEVNLHGKQKASHLISPRRAKRDKEKIKITHPRLYQAMMTENSISSENTDENVFTIVDLTEASPSNTVPKKVIRRQRSSSGTIYDLTEESDSNSSSNKKTKKSKGGKSAAKCKISNPTPQTEKPFPQESLRAHLSAQGSFNPMVMSSNTLEVSNIAGSSSSRPVSANIQASQLAMMTQQLQGIQLAIPHNPISNQTSPKIKSSLPVNPSFAVNTTPNKDLSNVLEFAKLLRQVEGGGRFSSMSNNTDSVRSTERIQPIILGKRGGTILKEPVKVRKVTQEEILKQKVIRRLAGITGISSPKKSIPLQIIGPNLNAGAINITNSISSPLLKHPIRTLNNNIALNSIQTVGSGSMATMGCMSIGGGVQALQAYSIEMVEVEEIESESGGQMLVMQPYTSSPQKSTNPSFPSILSSIPANFAQQSNAYVIPNETGIPPLEIRDCPTMPIQPPSVDKTLNALVDSTSPDILHAETFDPGVTANMPIHVDDYDTTLSYDEDNPKLFDELHTLESCKHDLEKEDTPNSKAERDDEIVFEVDMGNDDEECMPSDRSDMFDDDVNRNGKASSSASSSPAFKPKLRSSPRLSPGQALEDSKEKKPKLNTAAKVSKGRKPDLAQSKSTPKNSPNRNNSSAEPSSTDTSSGNTRNTRSRILRNSTSPHVRSSSLLGTGTPVDADKKNQKQKRQKSPAIKVEVKTEISPSAGPSRRESTSSERGNGGAGKRETGMLKELKNTDGYVAEKRTKTAENLFADPSELSREERALQRAIMAFSEMEYKRELKRQKVKDNAQKKANRIKKKAVQHSQKKESAYLLMNTTSRSAFSLKMRGGTPTKRWAPMKRCASPEMSPTKEVTVTYPSYGSMSPIKKLKLKDSSPNAVIEVEDTPSSDEELPDLILGSDDDNPRSPSPCITPPPVRVAKPRHKSTKGKLLRKKKSSMEDSPPTWLDFRSKSRFIKKSYYGQLIKPPVYMNRADIKPTVYIDRADMPSPSSGPFDGNDELDMADSVTNDAMETMSVSTTFSVEGAHLKIPQAVKKVVVNRESGENVLHKAARQGLKDVVLWCCQTGYADPGSQEHAGFAPLHECCAAGQLQIAKTLLAHGANINVTSKKDGIRPLHDALESDDIEMVRLLLSCGADPNLATYSGKSITDLIKSQEMREFIHNYFADLRGSACKEASVPWRFRDFVIQGEDDDLDDEVGQDLFYDCPPDPVTDDEMEDDEHFLFECSENLNVPLYRLEVEKEEGPRNYALLLDILQSLGMTKLEFTRQLDTRVYSMSWHDFAKSIEKNQIAAKCKWLPDAERKRKFPVDLVKWDDTFRELFGIEKLLISATTNCDNVNNQQLDNTTPHCFHTTETNQNSDVMVIGFTPPSGSSGHKRQLFSSGQDSLPVTSKLTGRSNLLSLFNNTGSESSRESYSSLNEECYSMNYNLASINDEFCTSDFPASQHVVDAGGDNACDFPASQHVLDAGGDGNGTAVQDLQYSFNSSISLVPGTEEGNLDNNLDNSGSVLNSSSDSGRMDKNQNWNAFNIFSPGETHPVNYNLNQITPVTTDSRTELPNNLESPQQQHINNLVLYPGIKREKITPVKNQLQYLTPEKTNSVSDQYFIPVRTHNHLPIHSQGGAGEPVQTAAEESLPFRIDQVVSLSSGNGGSQFLGADIHFTP